ncbi:hypothetical protein ACET3Z_001922 [Daucus carota]
MQITSSNLDSPASASLSGRRNGGFSSSPEFEFWVTRNPVTQPDIVPADELFVDGVLQPLDLMKPDPVKPTSDPDVQPGFGHGLAESDPKTVSKRWKDIFKKSGDRKIKNEEKEKKREKKGNGANGLSTAELNINIWPFSRSRSAGNGGNRPAPVSRKISSAPCSRSNSAGESKSRKWPSSPSRGGVHLGRNSPVWQVRRVPGASVGVGRGGADVFTRNSEKGIKNSEKGVQKDVNHPRRKKSVGGDVAGTGDGVVKAKVLNVNVPACIGYKSHLGCRSDEIERNAVVGGGGFLTGSKSGSAVHGGGNITGEVARGNSNLFNLRGLFTKKVY